MFSVSACSAYSSNQNIHYCVEAGDLESTKFLIDSDINLIDTIDDIYGRTPLIICSFKKSDSHFRIAEYLIECGCDVNIQANFKWNNWTALMTACYYNNLRMVDALINANANLDILDISSNTAKDLAQENGNIECVKLINQEQNENHQIEARLDLIKNIEDAVFKNDFELTKESLLKIKKENIKQILNSTNSGSQTLLHRACRNGNPKIVKLLLDNGAIARPHYYTKYSPLYIACHMGSLEIAQMILEKFPNLIQVTTIEKFLPFHAACSQGHLDILKLLVSFDSMPYFKPQSIYSDNKGNKYLCSFDLNSKDMNDQTGLYSAVLTNRNEICEYLLDLKLRILTEQDIYQYEQTNQQKLYKSDNETKKMTKPRTSSQISNKSSLSNGEDSISGSFFDHLKNVFLDIKSYDPYVINYTTNLDNDDEEEKEGVSSKVSVSNTEVPIIEIENYLFFNPIELDSYSKSGLTCLHESIRNKNFELAKLLLNHGANVNLPIYAINPASVKQTNESVILGNCLSEALIHKDELMFSYLLENYSFNEFNFNLAFKLCIELINNLRKEDEDEKFYTKNMISHLLKLKTISDSEHKITLRNKSSLKHLISSVSSANVSNLNNAGHSINFENGLILNWNNLDPKLKVVYESWLLNSSRYFITSNRNLRNSNSIDFINSVNTQTSLINEEDYDVNAIDESQKVRLNLNLKRLHLNVITRIDLSENMLENIPFALFQIESLKFMKLSSNKLKKLPVSRLQIKKLDDVNIKLVKLEKSQQAALNLSWNCNNLEELEIDKNELEELPSQLFLIKSLKHLNISHNNIDILPIEIWQAPSLIELNVSYNQLTSLPIISKCIKDNLNKQTSIQPVTPQTRQTNVRSRKDDSIQQSRPGITPVHDHPLKQSISQNEIQTNPRQMQICYEEKLVQKANFWHTYTLDSPSSNASLQSNLMNELSTQADEKTIKSKPKSITEQKANSTQRESKLIELNLSSNKFERIPECLSCLTPKLVKLNLSSNKIVSGAICDLPVNLKFLDLSNNCLKGTLRLLNENLLKFIVFYYTKYAISESGEDFKQLVEQNISSLLLDNEFCYLNLFKKYLQTTDKSLTRNSISEKPTMLREQRLSRDNYLIPSTNDTSPRARQPIAKNSLTSTPPSASMASNIKRRARSQSRNHRNMIPTHNNIPGTNRRILPFDLFLINLKYNRMCLNESNENEMIIAAVDILLHQNQTGQVVDYEDLEKKEKLLVNNQNIQIFMELMCPHKRHIKLENLKSLNLSQNKLKHFHLMFDLDASNKPMIPSNEMNFINSHYTLLSPKSNKDASKKKSNNNLLSTDSDFSMSDSELSSLDDYESIKTSLNEVDKNLLNSADKKSKTRLKNKLFESTLSPLKKKLIDKKNKNLLSFNRNEERIKMISKLMFPNLTHLDFSSNRIRFIPGNLVFLENLSYLNASSNKYLMRISPRIGLLNKLWSFDLKNCENIRYPANLDLLIKQRTKTADILGFLKSILEDSRLYTRIKLMFVGVQAIGKTSVLNRLREENGSIISSFNAASSFNKQTWSERTSNSSTSTNNQNISTVGIDINEWIYEKPNKKSSSSSSSQLQIQQQQSVYIYQLENLNKFFGPITFRTWDFAGQRDYYATHQYFISKRALYLVCWKLSEEEKGINEIHQWLSNIQTRAPGSPVIIVGTHQDQLAKLKNYKDISSYLQRIIYERFVRPTGENETSTPYPPIMASIEISSKTGFNIKQLARLIYDVAAQMKTPGIKDQLLMEQKIPVTYLALEECLNYILKKLKVKHRNPVLHTNNYLKEIRLAIEELYPDQNSLNAKTGTSSNTDLKNENRNILIRFRDDAEILQATQFLHENGIIIHYNDVALKDLFFLDPQWLCDILATVVTIREINPFAAKGIMKIKDLHVLFKGNRFIESEEIISFIVDLLSKFELALTWDNEHLLIPSLLPSEAILRFSNQDIRIGIISKKKAYIERLKNNDSYNDPDFYLNLQQKSQTANKTNNFENENFQQDQKNLMGLTKIINSYSQMNFDTQIKLNNLYECKPIANSKLSTTDDIESPNSVRRLYSLSYIPSGFFSRLITRILCDNILKECLLELFEIEYCFFNKENFETDYANSVDSLIDFVCQEASWKCFQTGIELKYLDYTLIKIKELIQDPLIDLNNKNINKNEVFLNNPILYRDCENEFKLKSSNKQTTFVECFASFKGYKIVQSKRQTSFTSPNNKIRPGLDVFEDNYEEIDQNEIENDILVKIFCKRQVTIKIFALIIEIIDNLLEDWYPDLGTRFMQDSKGDYLVTRLSPCSKCLKAAINKSKNQTIPQTDLSNQQDTNYSLSSSLTSHNESNNWSYLEIDEKYKTATIVSDNVSTLEDDELEKVNFYFSPDSNENEKIKLKFNERLDWIFCFMLDDICYSVLKNDQLICPKHGMQSAHLIAPDIAFEDIEDKFLIKNSNLKLENIIGRGSFGSVFSGSLTIKKLNSVTEKISKNDEKKIKVAVKVLETLNDFNSFLNYEKSDKKNIQQSDSIKFNEASIQTEFNESAKSKREIWNYRKSIRLAAKAYTVARQEVAIISSLKHENIVSMLGLSLNPLAIILELASGNLKDILSDYKANMSKLSPFVIQQVSLQISSALVYLHSNRIIYRDLKAENVLNFNFPRPNQTILPSNQPIANFKSNNNKSNFQESNRVFIKLADYSISRCVLPTGTKGFAGTEGFMAPEIVRFNGEETYSEKVDCFSFGMLLYELFSLKHPFEGQEQIKEIILNGGRPLIKNPEILNPTLMLDLMCLCWLDSPTERPTSEEIFKYSNSYEFSHLLDVTILEDYDDPPLVLACLNQELDVNDDLEKQMSFNESEFHTFSQSEDDSSNDEEIEEEEEDAIDLWVVRNSVDEGASQFEILTYENNLNCSNRKLINVCCEKIEALCVYNKNQVWCIDAAKCLYIYCCKTYRKINQYLLDIKTLSNIVSMVAIENVRRILLCSSNGMIILVNVELAHNLSLKNNDINFDNYLEQELEYYINDISIRINSTQLIPTRFDKNFDLWMGSSDGEIFCFSLKTMKLTGSYLHSTSYHYLTNSVLMPSNSRNSFLANENKESNVTILKTTSNDTFFLWSYIFPGTTIFLWNHVSKKIMSAYNCRKAFDEYNYKQIVSSKEVRIVEITFLNGNLYSGFNNGIVLVLKRLTLTPLLMFNAHMHQIHNLCPLTFETRITSNRNPTTVKKTQHMLVSLGRALTPLHEDIYLVSSRYRDKIGALKKYASCLILNAWICE